MRDDAERFIGMPIEFNSRWPANRSPAGGCFDAETDPDFTRRSSPFDDVPFELPPPSAGTNKAGRRPTTGIVRPFIAIPVRRLFLCAVILQQRHDLLLPLLPRYRQRRPSVVGFGGDIDTALQKERGDIGHAVGGGVMKRSI